MSARCSINTLRVSTASSRRASLSRAELLRRAIDKVFGADRRFARALDLGWRHRPEWARSCGEGRTSLSASTFRRRCSRRRNENAFINRLASMTGLVSCNGRRPFDLIVAATCSFTSTTGAVLHLAAGRLAASGAIAFSVETHAGHGVILRDTLRFAHGEPHVRARRRRRARCRLSREGLDPDERIRRSKSPRRLTRGRGFSRGGREARDQPRQERDQRRAEAVKEAVIARLLRDHRLEARLHHFDRGLLLREQGALGDQEGFDLIIAGLRGAGIGTAARKNAGSGRYSLGIGGIGPSFVFTAQERRAEGILRRHVDDVAPGAAAARY